MSVQAPRGTTSSSDADGVALRLESVSKSFDETVALDRVSLEVRPGTVHTVLGENGSGKSTLVKLLSGVFAPDRGEVVLGGEPLRPVNPRRCHELGLGTVFQEILVAPNRSVTDNVLLGQDGWWRWSINRKDRRELAVKVLAAISLTTFDPDAIVGDLSLARQQQVVIARALARHPRVLVLDESTAALDIESRDSLFAHIRRLVADGVAVVFISHRLDEVLDLSDAVTVLRSGRLVGTLSRSELSTDRLIHMMSPTQARPD